MCVTEELIFIYPSGKRIAKIGDLFLAFRGRIKVLYLFRTKTSTRQQIYVQDKIEARLPNHCCLGNAISITYSEHASVALVIQHAMRMRCYHIVNCCLPSYTTLCHIIVKL
jgi:hypothetical protein